jgi:hypothetical protein
MSFPALPPPDEQAAAIAARQPALAAPGADLPPTSLPDDFDTEETARDLLPDLEPDGSEYDLKLDADERTNLGRRVVREWENFRGHTEGRRSNAQQWRRAARMMPDDAAEDVEWLSAVRSPDTRRACQNHTTRLNNQIFQQSPPFTAKPKDREAVEHAPIIEEVLECKLAEMKWEEAGRKLHDELPVVSPVLLYVGWAVQKRMLPRHVPQYDDAAHTALLEQGQDPRLAYLGAWKTNQRGRNKGKLKVKFQLEEQIVYDGNVLKVIPFEDCILLPAGAKDEQDLWGIGERTTLRGADLKRGADSGKYSREDVDAVLGTGHTPDNSDRAERGSIVGVALEGQATSERDPLRQEFEVLELAWLEDFDQDGIEEWALLTVELSSSRVLRAQYLPYWHGCPPYVLFAYSQKATEIYGESTAELIAVLQEASSNAVNKFLNLLAMLEASQASFFYETGSGFDPDNFTMEFGSQIEVTRVSGIQPFPLAVGIPQTLEQIMQFLQWVKDQADTLTASSNPALGKETDVKKTATEVMQVLGQAQQIFEDHATGVALCWAKAAKLMLSNLAQYSDRGQVQYQRDAQPGLMMADPGAGPPPLPPGPGMPAPGPGMAPQGPQMSAPAPGMDPAQAQMQPGASMGPAGPAPPPIPAAMVGGQPQPAPGGVYFGSAPAEVLLANVEILPGGLGPFSDRQSRAQRSQMMMQILAENPVMQGIPEVQMVALDQVMQDLSYPPRDKVLQMGHEAIQAAQMAAQQAQMMQQQAMMAQGAQGQQAQEKAAALEQAPQTIAEEAYQKYQGASDPKQGNLAITALKAAHAMNQAGQQGAVAPPNTMGPR